MLFVFSAFAAEGDVEGAADHSVFPRLEGMIIKKYHKKSMDELVLPLKLYECGEKGFYDYIANNKLPDNWEKITGKVTRIRYISKGETGVAWDEKASGGRNN